MGNPTTRRGATTMRKRARRLSCCVCEKGWRKASITGKLTDPMLMKKPKVAADEPMNFPSVAIEPLGPGPARTMDVRPKMKPMVSPTPAARQFRAPSVWDRLNP